MTELDIEKDPVQCCWCGERKLCHNVVMLSRRAAVPGTGWGCVVCGLSNDGAIAVGCDDCGAGDAFLDDPRWVPNGYISDDARIPFSELATGPFVHDYATHRADEFVLGDAVFEEEDDD